MIGELGFEPPAIRLLTLNAHQGFAAFRRRKLLSRIRDALRASGADLVFLQEVGGDHGEDIPQQHYELLADKVWPQHAYGRNVVATGGHQGNALLSKFSIVRWQNVDVSVDGVEPRGLLHCVLDVQQGGPPLHAVCVHLGLREAQRRWQVERLLALVADAIPHDAPLVIAGDFNDWRERAHRRMLADPSFAEIHASANKRPARTFPAWWPRLRLDRIYVRNLHHRPLEMPRRPWSELSDHAPLAGEIHLGATRASSTFAPASDIIQSKGDRTNDHALLAELDGTRSVPMLLEADNPIAISPI